MVRKPQPMGRKEKRGDTPRAPGPFAAQAWTTFLIVRHLKLCYNDIAVDADEGQGA